MRQLPWRRWHSDGTLVMRGPLFLSMLATGLLAGCATHYRPEDVGDPFGLLAGLWHGFILPYSLAVNLLSWLLGLVGIDLFRSIEIIGRPNTGFWYYVGFVLGLAPYGGGKR